MKCNYRKVQQAAWQREAIKIAEQKGIEEAHKILDRECEDAFFRVCNLVFIAAKMAGISARKCKEIQNNLDRHVSPKWERMVHSDDQIGKGIGDFWAKDELKEAGYPYYEPKVGEM